MEEFGGLEARELERRMELLENEVELVGRLCERVKAEGREEGVKVLDLGCGTGKLGIFLSEVLGGAVEVTGVDTELEKVKKARENSPSTNITFEVQSAEELAFADETFDAVVSLKALHEIAEPGKALREASRVLKDGGQVFVVDWVGGGGAASATTRKTNTKTKAKTKTQTRSGHARKYFTRQRLEELLLDAGFRGLKIEVNREGELMLAEARKTKIK
ncbi:MAG: class I SAM-dependent methyltransferase [Methanophagales archaeon]|nr:class I SAM-dependent methyltransferase [Methanophagales archaeon]